MPGIPQEQLVVGVLPWSLIRLIHQIYLLGNSLWDNHQVPDGHGAPSLCWNTSVKLEIRWLHAHPTPRVTEGIPCESQTERKGSGRKNKQTHLGTTHFLLQ